MSYTFGSNFIYTFLHFGWWVFVALLGCMGLSLVWPVGALPGCVCVHAVFGVAMLVCV